MSRVLVATVENISVNNVYYPVSADTLYLYSDGTYEYASWDLIRNGGHGAENPHIVNDFSYVQSEWKIENEELYFRHVYTNKHKDWHKWKTHKTLVINALLNAAMEKAIL